MNARSLLELFDGPGLGAAYVLALAGLWSRCIVQRRPAGRLAAACAVAIPIALAIDVATPIAARIWHAAGGPVADPRVAAGIVALSGVLGWLAARAEAAGRSDALIRGTAIERVRQPIAWPLARRRRPRRVRLASHELAAADECKHVKLVGTTGTGKTTAIRGLLRQAIERGDSAVFADPDGAYAREFFDPERGDVLLNPFDGRSARWDPFGECGCAFDADQLARSLIADHPGEDRAWRGYARVMSAALIRRLLQAPPELRGSLHRLLIHAPTEELEVLLRDSAAAPYLGPENARFLASVRAIIGTHLAIFEHLDRPAGAATVSVRRWIRRRAGEPACLFLPYSGGQVATLRGAVSAWMRLAIFEAMEQPDDRRRIWFVVDELDALGAIDGLKDALVRLRKFGGRCVLGFQSIAQVLGTYGRFDAQTIVENCGNTLILRCSSGGVDGTSQFASRLIGEREIARVQVSRTRGGWPERQSASRTTVRQHLTEPAVLAAQIEQLPDFCGYLKLASAPAWRLVEPGDWSG